MTRTQVLPHHIFLLFNFFSLQTVYIYIHIRALDRFLKHTTIQYDEHLQLILIHIQQNTQKCIATKKPKKNLLQRSLLRSSVIFFFCSAVCLPRGVYIVSWGFFSIEPLTGFLTPIKPVHVCVRFIILYIYNTHGNSFVCSVKRSYTHKHTYIHSGAYTDNEK